MKKICMAILLTFLNLINPQVGAAVFSEGEEDWGKTCFLIFKSQEEEVLILTSPKNENISLIVLTAPPKSLVEEIVVYFEDGSQGLFQASISDYFGGIEATVDMNFIMKLLVNDSWSIKLADRQPVKLDTGIAKAELKKFLTCGSKG